MFDGIVSPAESPKWTINSVIFQGMKSQKTAAPSATEGSVVVGSPDDRVTEVGCKVFLVTYASQGKQWHLQKSSLFVGEMKAFPTPKTSQI